MVGTTIVDEIPDIYDEEYFKKTIKTLLIIEDLNYKICLKNKKNRWNRMYGTWSTHNNISVWSTFQTPFSSPPEIRQMCSCIVLWRIPDYNCMSILSSRFGVNAIRLRFIRKCFYFIYINTFTLNFITNIINDFFRYFNTSSN